MEVVVLGKSRLTLIQSLACARLVLWDETTRRLISFREMQAIRVDAANEVI